MLEPKGLVGKVSKKAFIPYSRSPSLFGESYEKTFISRRQPHLIRIEFHLGRKLPSWPGTRIFIPLAENQLRAVKDFTGNTPRKVAVGFAVIGVAPDIKRLTWSSFFPVGDANRPTPGHNYDKQPLNVGIGRAAHNAIVKFIAKRFANYRVTHDTKHLSQDRRKQLRKMRIEPESETPMAEYVEKSLKPTRRSQRSQ